MNLQYKSDDGADTITKVLLRYNALWKQELILPNPDIWIHLLQEQHLGKRMFNGEKRFELGRQIIINSQVKMLTGVIKSCTPSIAMVITTGPIEPQGE